MTLVPDAELLIQLSARKGRATCAIDSGDAR
jgi:hypothetical protein